MTIYTEILGNLRDAQWAALGRENEVDCLELDQWTAQKSRFVARSRGGEECAVALKRRSQLLDGDILAYRPDERRLLVVRLQLNEVLVAELGALLELEPAEAIRTALEFGHAIGNQHWPAVVRGTQVYIPLTVDRKVMESVLHTHRIERITYAFRPGSEVIPYLAPHEIRRLFGSAGPAGEVHRHAYAAAACGESAAPAHDHDVCCGHPHADGFCHEHPHTHADGTCHAHAHTHLDGNCHDHPHDHGFCGDGPHDHGNSREYSHDHGTCGDRPQAEGRSRAREASDGGSLRTPFHEHRSVE